jgi:hypothetical protein
MILWYTEYLATYALNRAIMKMALCRKRDRTKKRGTALAAAWRIGHTVTETGKHSGQQSIALLGMVAATIDITGKAP